MAVIKNVVSKKTMGLSTKIDAKILKAGEPMLVRFSDERELTALLEVGTFRVVEDGLPPRVIQGPKVIKTLITSDVTELPPKIIRESTSPEDVERESVPQAENLSTKCECGGEMILTTDPARPGIDIHYCPLCSREKIISEVRQVPVEEKVDLSKGDDQSDIPDSPTPAPKRVSSKCPICEKRKPQAATYCKKCEGEQKV